MALYFNGKKVIGSDGTCSADKVSVDDTDLAYEADDVQEALEKVTKSLTYAEYQELTEEEKNNGTIYLITDVNGDGQSFQPIIYSTAEREIGVWTDGKPLYEKTFISTTILPYNSDAVLTLNDSIPTGINVVDFKATARCVSLDGTPVYLSENGYWIGYYYNEINNAILGHQIFTSAGLSASKSIITLRYTKNTDTAGSGTWTPQGVPAVHYSTDEHIVGTWVDGSTLYEKTYEATSTISIGTSWSDTGFELPANTNRVIEGFIYRNAQSGALMYCAFSIGANNHLNAMLSIADNLDIGSSITIRYTKSS